jgi:phage head maturation protease
MEPDFSGWATKANLKCSDGRTIMPDAFAHMDGKQVPLVYQHDRNRLGNVLGYANLKHTAEGVRADGYFNSTTNGQNAKEMVKHGDLKFLSIYANNLIEKAGKNVAHGDIREVSLVLAGANPGAKIDTVNIKHSDGYTEELEDEAIISTGEELFHMDPNQQPPAPSSDGSGGGQSVADFWNSLSPDAQDKVAFIVEEAVKNAQEGGDPDGDGDDDTTAQGVVDDQGNAAHTDTKPGEGDLSHQEGADNTMSRNVFDQSDIKGPQSSPHALSHADTKALFDAARKCGSLSQAIEDYMGAHDEASGYALQHGIEPVDVLFPNFTNLDKTPQFLSRRMEWVDGVLSGTSKTPFSNVRSIVADITMDEARALGYIKGNYKKEEWFAVQKRTTSAATIYKKQKLDRDDIIEITDFDVVAWMKTEMMVMLKEEIARAILIGDGRDVADPDKIQDPMNASSGNGLRSIINEHELYMTNVTVNTNDANSTPLEVREAVLRAFRFYKGSGRPTFYTTIPTVNYLLLAKDQMGRYYWNSEAELASALGVDSIVKVEVMEMIPNLFGIIVNLSDYNVGANKGGEISNFDFFDIDFNQYKYLAETRLSGALTKPKSALVIWSTAAANVQVTPTKPTFVKSTGVVTIPTVTGVVYENADTNATLTAGAQTALTNGQTLNVRAVAASGYFIEETGTLATVWSFMMPGVATGDTD